MCVSVVMPVRNAERTIEEAVRSVLIHQEVAELLLVDDGSTDATRDRISEFEDSRITVLEGPSRGMTAAPINIGLRAAKSPLIARCDADDLLPCDRFAWQIELLRRDSSLVAVSAGFKTVDVRGREIAQLGMNRQALDVTSELRRGVTSTHLCTWLMQAEAIRRIGGFREWFDTSSDVDVQCRLAFEGRVWHEPRIAYIYRLHDNSITHRTGAARREFFDRCAREFARQRAERGTDALEEGCPPAPPPAGGAMGSARHQAAGQLVGAGWRAFERGEKSEAIRLIRRAVLMTPCSVATWRSLIAAAMKRPPKCE